ncbi:MAG: CUAEP/CCAEP-tail radical SAM protein, partial [Calditrichota bacterium]
MRVLLISTYEIGRQPFGLASPAAWLRSDQFMVETVDCAVEPFPQDQVKTADIIAFFLPMYTAARLSIPLIKKVRNLNPECTIVAYGLYAPVNEDFLKRNSVQKVIGGEFEQPLLDYCRSIRSQGSDSSPAVSLERQK